MCGSLLLFSYLLILSDFLLCLHYLLELPYLEFHYHSCAVCSGFASFLLT